MAKVSEIIRIIKKQTNCYLLREGRNHEIWFNPDTRKEFQIPRHHSKELPTGTANNILKAAGIYKTI
ncbi:MAG: type II toxin-antitoxin system HicA family toxin [Dorea sp.]|jgi:predicted RNA binding protein YcfA (HicA-like mRNA interferase family)|uniref:type II toxin-antitoxin system HicA family toxin n=1 Tax=Sporofaciens sp. JLR.KK001 TaxID=3112621 RepID=UPI002170170F|nr:type II toxin-antitoxin system HicA family toxin [Dorea sp.]